MKDTQEEPELPERSCILTRTIRQPDELIRFVLSPDGVVTPDLKRGLPGRGAWLTADRASLEEAMRKKLFARAFRSEAKLPADLAGLVEHLLFADALSGLSMANKAGVVTTGFVKVEAALAAKKIAILLNASDGSEDGLRKMRQAVTRIYGGSDPILRISLFSTAQLSLCLGRENVIHAGLSGAKVTDRFVEKCRRLIRYRDGVTSEPGLVPAENAGSGPSFI
jgi:uncharacterized protein